MSPEGRADPPLTELADLRRRLRTEVGLTPTELAKRSTVTVMSIWYTEHCWYRPRKSMLSALALGLDSDRHQEILDQLVDDPPGGWWSYRRRRLALGIEAGTTPIPSKIANAVALHRAADSCEAEADALWRQAERAADDHTAAALERRAAELDDQAAALRREAGPPVALGLAPLAQPLDDEATV